MHTYTHTHTERERERERERVCVCVRLGFKVSLFEDSLCVLLDAPGLVSYFD